MPIHQAYIITRIKNISVGHHTKFQNSTEINHCLHKYFLSQHSKDGWLFDSCNNELSPNSFIQRGGTEEEGDGMVFFTLHSSIEFSSRLPHKWKGKYTIIARAKI